jgi:hypothetical protein
VEPAVDGDPEWRAPDVLVLVVGRLSGFEPSLCFEQPTFAAEAAELVGRVYMHGILLRSLVAVSYSHCPILK